MVDSVDVDCAMNILGKQAVDIAQKTGTLALRITARLSHAIRMYVPGMETARARVHQVTVEMLKFAKSGGAAGE